jgi:hypothetical protein
MTDKHPITPPPELVDKWVNQSPHIDPEGYIATRAAQWGADQEHEASCEWLSANSYRAVDIGLFRHARRPRPSLKQQALNVYNRIYDCNQHQDFETIRRALEQLPDDTTP